MRKLSKEQKRQAEKDEVRRTRAKTIGQYFLAFTPFIRQWLKDMTGRYKARGIFPLNVMTLLPSFYTDKRDKEVAIFIAAAVTSKGDVMDKTLALRAIIGDSPWNWFVNRGFVSLSLGKMQNKRTAGVENWRLSHLMDILYGDKAPDSLFEAVHKIAASQLLSYVDALKIVYEGLFYPTRDEWKIRMLLMVLATPDGFGQGVWEIDTREIYCPVTPDVRLFISTFFPNYTDFGTADEAIHLFGFDSDYELYYAYLGYKELQRTDPQRCKTFATVYHRAYEHDDYRIPSRWKRFIPEEKFNP